MFSTGGISLVRMHVFNVILQELIGVGDTGGSLKFVAKTVACGRTSAHFSTLYFSTHPTPFSEILDPHMH